MRTWWSIMILVDDKSKDRPYCVNHLYKKESVARAKYLEFVMNYLDDESKVYIIDEETEYIDHGYMFRMHNELETEFVALKLAPCVFSEDEATIMI